MSDHHINHIQYEKEGRTVAFAPSVMEKVQALIGRYPQGQHKSALIPILHIAQEEFGGHLTVDIMDYVAEILNLQPIEVYETASFYSMFYFDKVGKYVLEVCRTGPCSLAGGDKIRAYLRQALEINPGETTADGLFTLKEVECLGSCGTAPVMQINTEFYEQLTPARVDHILAEMRSSAGRDKSEDTTWAGQYC